MECTVCHKSFKQKKGFNYHVTKSVCVKRINTNKQLELLAKKYATLIDESPDIQHNEILGELDDTVHETKQIIVNIRDEVNHENIYKIEDNIQLINDIEKDELLQKKIEKENEDHNQLQLQIQIEKEREDLLSSQIKIQEERKTQLEKEEIIKNKQLEKEKQDHNQLQIQIQIEKEKQDILSSQIKIQEDKKTQLEKDENIKNKQIEKEKEDLLSSQNKIKIGKEKQDLKQSQNIKNDVNQEIKKHYNTTIREVTEIGIDDHKQIQFRTNELYKAMDYIMRNRKRKTEKKRRISQLEFMKRKHNKGKPFYKRSTRVNQGERVIYESPIESGLT